MSELRICELCGKEYDYSGRGEKAAKYCVQCRSYRLMTEKEVEVLKSSLSQKRAMASRGERSLPKLTRRQALLIIKDSRFANQQPNLSFVNLSKIDFSGADLQEVNFSRADLSETNLNDANLRNANLLQSNLRGARQGDTDFTGATLNGVRGLRGQKDDKGDLFGRRRSIGALTPTGGQPGYSTSRKLRS